MPMIPGQKTAPTIRGSSTNHKQEIAGLYEKVRTLKKEVIEACERLTTVLFHRAKFQQSVWLPHLGLVWPGQNSGKMESHIHHPQKVGPPNGTSAPASHLFPILGICPNTLQGGKPRSPNQPCSPWNPTL